MIRKQFLWRKLYSYGVTAKTGGYQPLPCPPVSYAYALRLHYRTIYISMFTVLSPWIGFNAWTVVESVKMLTLYFAQVMHSILTMVNTYYTKKRIRYITRILTFKETGRLQYNISLGCSTIWHNKIMDVYFHWYRNGICNSNLKIPY